MQFNLRRVQTSIFVTISIILILVCGFVWWNVNLTIQNGEWVKHTNQVLETSEKVISLLKDIETGQRGYIITKDSLFLEPYFKSYDLTRKQLNVLRSLTLDNPRQQLLTDSLTRLVSYRIKVLDNSIVKFNEEGIDAAFYKSFELGKSVMDSVRVTINHIQAVEDELLKKREARLESSIYVTQLFIKGLLLILALFLCVSYYILRYLQAKKDMDAKQIHDLNQELSHTIEELRSANEEIHAVNEELSSTNEEFYTTNEQLHNSNRELSAATDEIKKLNSQLENRLALILENSFDLVCYANIDGDIEYLNAAGRRLLGVPGDMDVSMILGPDFLSPENWENIMIPAMEEVDRTGFWQGNVELINRNKEKVYMWLQIMVVKNDATGKPYRAVIGHDFTKEKKSQDDIIKNENRYRLLFENNPQPMWIFDVDSKVILEANNAASSKYGYLKNEFEGMKLSQLRPQAEIKKFNNYVETLPQMGYMLTEDVIHQTKSGEILLVDIHSYGFELNGKLVRLILINDVTAKKKTEENLKKINAELIKQNEQLDRYVYVVSHNIRGPIASLLGLVNMLNFEEWPEHIAPVIHNMHQTSLKLDSVIMDLNKILTMRNNLNAAREKVNIHLLITDIFQMLHDQIETTQARFVLKFEQEEITIVKSYLHSIFINLISNAIKYREVNRPLTITITSKIKEDHMQINVSDNGMGIDLSRNGDKLFGLYKRFHFHVEGKGLGLHLVKTQVEALGGQISVKSQLNVGTTFSINLPLQ